MAEIRTRTHVITIGSLVKSDRGIKLVCACGHKTALLPAQLSAMAHPETSALNFKRRFRCSMCGRNGASNEIKLSTFAVEAPFTETNEKRAGEPARSKPS
jgi:hypothetical protein